MKKILLFLVIMSILFAAVILTVFAPRQPWQVDIILRSAQQTYWQSVERGARDAAAEFNVSLNVYSTDREDNYDAQLNLSASSIANGADALIIAPAHDTALAETLSGLRADGIPLIGIDSRANAIQPDTQILTNNAQAIRMLCEQMFTLTGRTGRIAVISAFADNGAAREREESLAAYLAENSQLQIVTVIHANGDTALARDRTLALLQGDPGLDLVVALDAAGTIGAAQAIEAQAGSGQQTSAAASSSARTRPALYGFDCTTDEAIYLERDILTATIVQNPYVMGYLSVKAAVDRLHGRTLPPFTYTPVIALTKANMFASINQMLEFPMN